MVLPGEERPPALESVPALVMQAPDLDIVEDAIAGFPLEAARLTATRGSVRVVGLQLGTLSLTVGSFNFPIATFGEPKPNAVVIGLPLTAGEGSWNGVGLDRRSLWTYPPGVEHQGLATAPPAFAAMTLPIAEAEALLSPRRWDVRKSDEARELGGLLRTLASNAGRSASTRSLWWSVMCERRWMRRFGGLHPRNDG